MPYLAGRAFEGMGLNSFVLVRSSGGDSGREREIAENMLHNGIQGLLLSPADIRLNGPFFEEAARHIPVVQLDQTLERAQLPGILFDYRRAGAGNRRVSVPQMQYRAPAGRPRRKGQSEHPGADGRHDRSGTGIRPGRFDGNHRPPRGPDVRGPGEAGLPAAKAAGRLSGRETRLRKFRHPFFPFHDSGGVYHGSRRAFTPAIRRSASAP